MAQITRSKEQVVPVVFGGLKLKQASLRTGVEQNLSHSWDSPVNYTGDNRQGSFDSITYTGGPKTTLLSMGDTSVSVPVFKSCTHHSNVRVYRPGVGGMIVWSDLYNRYSFESDGTALPTIGACNPNLAFGAYKYAVSHDTIASAYTPNGYSSIYQLLADEDSLLGFKEAFNVLSFIGELRDVRNLPKLITRWTKSDKDISDKFLGVQFGVLPFASDIKAIVNRLYNQRANISKWDDMAANGKVLNGHVMLPLPDVLRSNPHYVGEMGGQHIFQQPEVERAVSERLTIGGKQFQWYASYSVTQAVSARASVYYIPVRIPGDKIDDIKREIWGLNKPLSAVWNLIPFSFVVDWFTNIGDLISSFEESKPLLPVKVVACGYSVRIITTVTVKTRFDTLDTGEFIHTYTSYYRIPLAPASIYSANKLYGSLRFSPINDDQALLGTALLHQLLR